jgi:hypothetical protein
MSLSLSVMGPSLFLSSIIAPYVPFDSDWTGSMHIGMPIFLHFSKENAAVKGTIDILEKGIRSAPLNMQSSDPAKIQFSLKTETGNFDFSGTLKEGRISGEVQFGNDSGTFQIVRLAKTDPIQNQQYFGIYELFPDRFFYIRTWDERFVSGYFDSMTDWIHSL